MLPGASAVKTAWICLLPVEVVTFVPRATVITCPEIVAQYSPAPGVAQLEVLGPNPAPASYDTLVTDKLA